MTDNSALNELDRLISEIPNLAAPSNTKFRHFDAWLTDVAGVPAKTCWVSRPGNAGKCLIQPGFITGKTSLAVAVLPKEAYLDSSMAPARRLVGPGRMFKAIAFVTRRENGQWYVAGLVEPPMGPLSPRLSSLFGNFKTVAPVIDSEVGIRGPAAVLNAAPLMTDARIRRMLRLAIASSTAVILVGPPGTGKTRMLKEILDEVADDPAAFNMAKPPSALMVTPEEGWTNRDLVGGETVDEKARLVFRPGHLLEAIRNDKWLILDEANRADMDKIFGGLLTWLSDQSVTLGRVSTEVGAPSVELGWADTPTSVVEGIELLEQNAPAASTDKSVRFLAGRDWRLLGTYNALDAQRVFRFGQALGRRFTRVPIPPISAQDFDTALAPQVEGLPARVGEAIGRIYEAHLGAPATHLGPAIFFKIQGYVRAGLELPQFSEDVEAGYQTTGSSEETEASPMVGGNVDQLLAEGYLTAAGTWLAKLDESELVALGQRVVESGALSAEEWIWLRALLPTLG